MADQSALTGQIVTGAVSSLRFTSQGKPTDGSDTLSEGDSTSTMDGGKSPYEVCGGDDATIEKLPGPQASVIEIGEKDDRSEV